MTGPVGWRGPACVRLADASQVGAPDDQIGAAVMAEAGEMRMGPLRV